MSGFVVLFDRQRETIPAGQLEPLLGALDHRGPHGRRTLLRQGLAIGVQHLFTTLEDEGHWQPLRDEAAGVELVFDGRLDNRHELLELLGLAAGQPSDAAIVLAAFARWGTAAFDRFLGPFALVLVDHRRWRLVAARDGLGDRSLCYHLTPRQLLIASEPVALLRHCEVSGDPDETSLARFFAVEPPAAGHTYFQDVQELPAGHWLELDGQRLRLERYWRPWDQPPLGHRSDHEWVETFRGELVDAVRRRLRSPGRSAVLMSGGLDSTSVAAIAADLLGTAGGEQLTTISWVFDELPEADERRFIEPMAERFDLDRRLIVADGEWPLRDLASWPVDANAPWQGLYCRLQNRAYAVAREVGSSILLTGEYGDHLYGQRLFWLRELLAAGRLGEGLVELRRALGGAALWRLYRPGPARAAAVRALGWRGGRPTPPPWLTSRARELRATAAEVSATVAPRRRSHRLPITAHDPLAAHASSLEVAAASRAGIEVRRPYRDRRLVELFGSLPVHLIDRPQESKRILRQAMTGLLPEPVRRRRWGSTLLPLARRGLVERERDTVEQLLGHPEALWRRYVRPDWLERSFPALLREGIDGVESVVAWQCLCAELWWRRP